MLFRNSLKNWKCLKQRKKYCIKVKISSRYPLSIINLLAWNISLSSLIVIDVIINMTFRPSTFRFSPGIHFGYMKYLFSSSLIVMDAIVNMMFRPSILWSSSEVIAEVIFIIIKYKNKFQWVRFYWKYQKWKNKMLH